ncbi:mucin-binding protein, partial [Ligilactobacillus murinus]
MLRYNANSRLFKYTTEEKKRYKLYKKKKMWVVAGMSLFSTATLVNANASADELSTTAVAIDGTQKAATQSEENKTNDETLKEEVTTENKASEKENDITENKASEKEADITENKVSEKETDTVEDKTLEKEEVHVEEKLTPDTVSELTNSEVTTEPKQDQAESVTKERPKIEPQTDRVEETKASATLAPKEAPLEAANETLTAPTSETETSVSEKDADKKEQTPQIQGQEVTSDKADVILNASDRLSGGAVFRRVVDQATKETISLLATPASAEPQADGASIERSIKVSSVTKGTQTGILSDPKKLADNSTEYILTSDIFFSGEPKVGMTVTYTGKNGDTFSMRVVPGENTASDYYNNPGYEMRPSGNPIKEWKDGSYLFTWTITGAPENVSVARTQTIPAVPFFRENTSVEGNYKPYFSGSDSGILKPGASYSLKFFINGQAAPADTTVKFVADKILKIKRTYIATDSSAFPNRDKTNKTTDTNYVYQVKVGLAPLVSGRSPYVKTAALNYTVPVPEHFLLDVDATTEYLNKTTHKGTDPYRGGNTKVTQPGGEGTPILIETKGITTTGNSGDLYMEVPFIGRYTSTETSGESDIVSGWFDLGDGQKHYFGKVNIDTNEALNDPEYLKQSTGFRENILPKDATEVKNGITIPAVHENYYVRLWYSSDDQQYMITNHVSSDYSYVKREGSTHIPAEIKRRLPALEKGDPSAPLLYAVGLGANGLTEFKPTYHFDFPDEITSTGIVMPLNNVTDDYADYESYNPAQPGYTVVVTGNDGSKITQRLLAGESYNPITGSIDHFGNFSKGEKLAEGVKIAAYDVTPDKEYYASAYLNYYSVHSSSHLNDITTGYINILGYLNTKAQSDVEYISNVVVESANKYVPVQFKTKKIDELKLPVIVDDLPMSSNNGNQQTILNLNDTYSIQLRAYGVKYVGNARVNLDAGGTLQGKPNKTATDLPGHALNIPFGTVKEPILYFTVPNQMTIENISGTNQFYKVYWAEGSVPKPQITRKQNLDGQVVYILDWTGTGFELSSKMVITFNMRVKKQGLNDFDPAQTEETLYAYEDVANKKTLDLYTEQQLKAKGVSIEGLKAYKPNVDSTNNTSWLQISGDLSETTLLGSYKTKMTFADGTSADTMMLGSSSNRYYLRIIAPVEVRPAPLIKGTKDAELGITGVNYPVKDYYEVDGKKVGLQELQLGMVNNTADPLKGVISVMNLPQVGEKDGNDLSSNATEQGFTLNISEQGKLAFDPTNNNAKDAHTLYYSTSPVTLSSDGTTLRFANGTVWTRGQALPSELLTAQQVTDWSTIKALVMYIPSLSEGNQILYHFNAYSPTSETNMSKRVKLLQVGGYEKQASLVMGDVTDSYATYATLRIVDQAGNQINGYKEVRGQAILDPDTHEYVVENKDLFGEAGKALVLDPPATITGYKFVQNNFSSTVLQADGSTVVTRSYQVDRARVLEGSLSGPVLAEATGDPQANTGNNFQADPTGVSEITFNLTDAQLARKGYKYKITVVDRNNKELVDKNGRTDYDTLAEALEAHGMFDNNNDRYGATQNFIVNYIGNFQKAVIISQNDPAKEIPMSVNEAGVVSPYYSDGQSGQVMFYNEDGAPLISDNTLLGNGTPAFKRQDYRYTVTAPDGTTYSSIDKAMGAKLKFDNTENDGEVDRDIQVYRIDYVKDLQNLRLTIIDDEGDLDGSGAKILVDNVELGSGLSGSVVDEETKTSYASWIKRYTDQGYVVVRQDELPTNYDNDPTVDQTVVVHLKHGTEEKAGSSKTLVQRINYVYESGVKKGEEAAPRYSKAFTFTSVDTIDKVTKKVIRTVWSPDQTAPVVVSPTIKGYDLSRSEIQQIVSVDSTDSELTHTVLYYPEIQTLNVKIIDDTLGETIIQGTLATGYTNAELPASVYQQYQNYIDAYTNAGYVLVSKDLLPANFDEDSTVDQEVVVHLKHGTKQEAGVDKTVTQTITYVYGNGP